MRDGDKGSYHGKSVLKAVENINKIIAPAVLNKVGILITKSILLKMKFLFKENIYIVKYVYLRIPPSRQK